MHRPLLIVFALFVLATAGCPRGTPVPSPSNDDKKDPPPPVRKDPAAAELERLLGAWAMRSMEEKGKPVADAQGRHLVFAGELFNLFDGRGNLLAHGVVKIDPDHKAMDLAHQDKALAGQTAASIYVLEGDILKICMAPPGEGRPTDFASAAKAGATVLTLNRVKGPITPPDPAASLARLQGVWVVISVEEKGRTIPDGVKRKFIVLDEQFNLREPDDKLLAEGTVKTGESVKAWTLDLVQKDGKPRLGLYALQGDRLRLCLAAPGEKRPEQFATTPADNQQLLVLRRQEDLQADAELEKLQGTWVVASAELKGKPDAAFKGQQFVFLGEVFNVRSPKGEELATGTCKVNPNRKEMDLIHKRGQQAGKTAPSLYSLDGDTLRICMAPPGAKRPTELAAKGDSEVSLLVLKREK